MGCIVQADVGANAIQRLPHNWGSLRRVRHSASQWGESVDAGSLVATISTSIGCEIVSQGVDAVDANDARILELRGG